MTDRLGEGNKLSNSEFDGECQKYKYKTKHKQLAKSLEVLSIEKYESEALNKLLEEFYSQKNSQIANQMRALDVVLTFFDV